MAVTESQNYKLNIIKCISFIYESQQAANRGPSGPGLVLEAILGPGGFSSPFLLQSWTLTSMDPIMSQV